MLQTHTKNTKQCMPNTMKIPANHFSDIKKKSTVKRLLSRVTNQAPALPSSMLQAVTLSFPCLHFTNCKMLPAAELTSKHHFKFE